MKQQAGEIFDERGFTTESVPTDTAVDRSEWLLLEHSELLSSTNSQRA
jgi:hypothetical protein